MQFQITPDVAHLFADAVAAHIRGRANISQPLAEHERWSTLWLTFRDATDATLYVPDDVARLMFYVWGVPAVWRDEQTRRTVRDHLRPQWRAQLTRLPMCGHPGTAEAVGS